MERRRLRRAVVIHDPRPFTEVVLPCRSRMSFTHVVFRDPVQRGKPCGAGHMTSCVSHDLVRVARGNAARQRSSVRVRSNAGAPRGRSTHGPLTFSGGPRHRPSDRTNRVDAQRIARAFAGCSALRWQAPRLAGCTTAHAARGAFASRAPAGMSRRGSSIDPSTRVVQPPALPLPRHAHAASAPLAPRPAVSRRPLGSGRLGRGPARSALTMPTPPPLRRRLVRANEVSSLRVAYHKFRFRSCPRRAGSPPCRVGALTQPDDGQPRVQRTPR